MEHHTDNSWGIAGGLIASIGSYLISIDWSMFLEQLGTEVLKVGILGVVGGVCGLVGKKIAAKYFFKKKQ